MKVSLIIPMYNESSIIDGALKTFSDYMRSAFEDWELPVLSAYCFPENTASDGGEASFPVYQKEKAMDKPHIAQECPKAIEKSSRLRYRFTP